MNSMILTKYPILWLPLASLGIYVLLIGLAWRFHPVIFWYAILLCWTGSFVCGHDTISRNKDKFPFLYWLSFLFFLFASFPLFGCWIVPRVFMGLTIPLWLVSFGLSLGMLICDAKHKVHDFHTWVLFGTQILWTFLAVGGFVGFCLIDNYVHGRGFAL